jgi:site-specific recombinase XerD
MKYYKVVSIKGRKQQGYINAVSLGWDSIVWRFSLKTDDKKLAQKRLKKLFRVLQTDTRNRPDYKEQLERIINNENDQPNVPQEPIRIAIPTIKDSLDYIMEQYVNNFEISDCLECDKTREPFHIGYQEKFCHECKHFKNKKQWDTQKSRKNKLNEFFGGVRIQDFDFDLVKEYILEMKNTKSKQTQKPLAADTIISYLDCLKAALNLYYDENDTPVPFNIRKFLRYKKYLTGKYKLKKQERTDDFTKDKLDLLLNRLTDEQTKLILETMYYVPSRISEYMRMRKTQFEYPYLTIEASKDGDIRKIKLKKSLADRYQEMIENSETDLIFNTSYRTVYGQFTRTVKTLKLNLVIHQLRIRAATRAISKGANIKQVQKLGGWKTETMVLRYQKLATNELDEVSDMVMD